MFTYRMETEQDSIITMAIKVQIVLLVDHYVSTKGHSMSAITEYMCRSDGFRQDFIPLATFPTKCEETTMG